MSSPSRRARPDHGFTLVEILIAIVLVGILTAVVVVGVGSLTSKGSSAACTASADAANAGVTTWFASNGSYPTTITQMTGATPPALSLPSGVGIDASGLVASGTGWTMAMATDGVGGRPTFLCGGDLPTGFSIGPNGHFYKYVNTPVTWAAAGAAARAVTSGSLTGYLVTITSDAENAYVQTLTGNVAAWTGGSDIEVENTWRWVDGPESGQQFWNGKGAASGGAPVSGRYSMWNGTGEPNGDAEDCGTFIGWLSTWNDLACTTALGYVVELGGWTQPSCSGVATNISTAAEAYRASTGSYPTTITQLLTGTPAPLALPAGLTVDAGGQAVSSSSYTVAMWPNGASPPDVMCSDAPPSGWSVGPNGHLYRFVSTASTWAAASTAGPTFTQFGRTGHLATVTSSTEVAFVAGLQGNATAWLAGSDAATENTWIWTAGPEAGTQFWSGKGAPSGGVAVGGQFTNWPTGEPNGDAEDCLQSYAGGLWNDLACTSLMGYLVEIDP